MTPSACFQVLTLNVSKEARLLIYRKILPLNTWKVYFSIVGSGNPIYFILYKQDSEKGGVHGIHETEVPHPRLYCRTLY